MASLLDSFLSGHLPRNIDKALSDVIHETLDSVEELLAPWLPPVSVYENSTAFHLQMELPGVSKENIKIELKNQNIVISGKKDKQVMPEEFVLMHNKFHYGSFSRNIPLSKKTNSEDIVAEFKNGILSIIVGKKPETAAKNIPIL